MDQHPKSSFIFEGFVWRPKNYQTGQVGGGALGIMFFQVMNGTLDGLLPEGSLRRNLGFEKNLTLTGFEPRRPGQIGRAPLPTELFPQFSNASPNGSTFAIAKPTSISLQSDAFDFPKNPIIKLKINSSFSFKPRLPIVRSARPIRPVKICVAAPPNLNINWKAIEPGDFFVGDVISSLRRSN